MGFGEKVLWGIVVVTLTLLSLGGFLVALGIIPANAIVGVLTDLEQQLLVRGILISFSAFLFVLSMVLSLVSRERGGAAIIPLKNPLGMVNISQRAICEFIQRVGEEVEGIKDIKARIRPSNEEMDVYLILSARAEGEIPRLINELQTLVKKYLNHTVGIENVREIKVKVARIL